MADDLDRLRCVTARFRELQGLRLVAWGISSGVSATIYLVAPSSSTFWLVVALAIGGWVLPDPLVRRYYRERFGRSEPIHLRGRSGFLIIGVSVVGPALDNLFHIGPIAVPLALMIGYDLWTIVSDWPFRWHRGLTAAAAAIALVVQFGTWPVDTRVAAAFLLVGLAAIPVGVLDHRLLMSVMKRRPETPVEEPQPSP